MLVHVPEQSSFVPNLAGKALGTVVRVSPLQCFLDHHFATPQHGWICDAVRTLPQQLPATIELRQKYDRRGALRYRA